MQNTKRGSVLCIVYKGNVIISHYYPIEASGDFQKAVRDVILYSFLLVWVNSLWSHKAGFREYSNRMVKDIVRAGCALHVMLTRA